MSLCTRIPTQTEVIRNILAVKCIFLCCTDNHRQPPRDNGAEQH